MIRYAFVILSIQLFLSASQAHAQGGGPWEGPCWEIPIGNETPCSGPACEAGGGGPTGNPGGPGDPPHDSFCTTQSIDYIDPSDRDFDVTCADKIPEMLTGDAYLDAVHLWKWVPTAQSLMDLFTWEGGSTIGTGFVPTSAAPVTLAAEMQAFDGDSYELNGMTPPGEATLHDFYGVDLATGQVEVSLPTGIRLTGINGDDIELKINIRSGVERRGIVGNFASLNMEDRLVINKLIPLTESTPGTCFTGQSEMWKIRDLVNSTPTFTRLRGGNPEVWFNTGPPSTDPNLNLLMNDSAFFAGMPAQKWAILHQNSSLCRWSRIDGTPKMPLEEFLWKSGQIGQPPPTTSHTLNSGAADPYLTDLPDNPPWVYNVFVAGWGTSEILRWNCDNVVIMDADGTKTVYSGFYKQKDTRVCLSEAQLPHGGQQGTLPTTDPRITEYPRSMAQVQLAARCLYKETRDGLRTYYLYNIYGELVGFRDPAGREIGFNRGRIHEIRDEFGRSCNLLYDDNGNLLSIALPEVDTGAPGQSLLPRVIEVKITEEVWPPRPGHFSLIIPGDLAERVRLKKLEIGTPLDAPGTYSFEADFEEYGDLVNPASPYKGNRVTSVRVSSDRMPDWLGGQTAGGTTTYSFPLMDYTTCDNNSAAVVETRPDGKVVTHWFDAIGNLVQVDEPAQLSLSGSEQTVTTLIVSDRDTGADELNLKTSMVYPDNTQEAWKYQFQSDGGLGSYFNYVVGMETHQQFYAKHNVLNEHKKGTQAGDLVTSFTYGEYRRLKSKTPPLPFGTDLSGMEFEHTFDYELANPPIYIRNVIVQTRYPNVSNTPYSETQDLLHTFEYNNYGQLMKQMVWNDGVKEITDFTRHDLNDPDGDGTEDWSIDGIPTGLPGYLEDEVFDPTGLNLVTSHAYDRWGNEIQTTHPGGNQTYRQFNEMNQVYAIHEGTFTVTPPSGGNPAVITPPSSPEDGYARTEHLFDAAGNVTVLRKYNDNPDTGHLGETADAVTTKYFYDGLDRLVQVDQELAHPIELAPVPVEWLSTYWLRDALGRITLEVRPNASATSVIYSPQGTVLEYREHANPAASPPQSAPAPSAGQDRVMELTYDANKRVVEGRDALGESEVLYYDQFGRLVGRRNPHGTLTVQVLNNLGLPVSESVYDPSQALPNASGPLKQTDYTYDERFRVVQQDVHWFTKVNGVATDIEDGSITSTYEYDAEDQLRFETNDRGAVTEIEYDAAGRKRTLRYPQTGELPPGTQNEDQWTYDANGNVTLLKLVEFGVPDGQGTPIEHTYTIAYDYDDLNRERRIDRVETGTVSADTERWYDSLGNVLRELQPSTEQQVGAKFTVDTAGRVVQIEEGYTSDFTAGATDLVTSTNPDGLVTLKKTYDAVGNVISEWDDLDHATDYTYDLLGRRTQVTYGDGTYEQVLYRQDDLVSDLDAFDASGTLLFGLSYTYEAKRRTVENYTVNYGPFTGLFQKTFTYDDLDRPTLATARSKDPHSANYEWWTDTARTYDSLDRLLSDTQALTRTTLDTGAETLFFTADVTSDYDALGNVEKTTSSVGSDDTFAITRTFDRLNRLLTVAEVADTPETENTVFGRYEWRGARGRIETIRHPVTGTKTRVFDYDQRGRPRMRLTEKNDGSPLAGRQYDYGASSVRLFESKLPGPSTDDHVFTHDALDRLTDLQEGDYNEATGAFAGLVTASESIGYDGAGSMRDFTTAVDEQTTGSFTNPTDDTNAYASGFNGKVATRDERGNMSEIGNHNLVYDVFGHLVGTIGPFPFPLSPSLEIRDAFDRRVFRKYGSAKTSFVFEGLRVIQEVLLDAGPAGEDVVEREYLHGAGLDELVGQRIDGQAYAMHMDSLGTPYAATNTSGELAETYDTDPFGNRTITDEDGGGPIGNRIGFAGMWYDAVTDLHYARARHYSPWLRRFTARDPLGVWGDIVNRGSAYAYVWNSPTRFIDPTGLKVYHAARDLDGLGVGTHQFVIVIPDDPTKFHKLQDFGNGESGYTLGAFKTDDGRLQFRANDDSDMQAAREALNPSANIKWYTPDLDAETRLVGTPSWMNDTEFITTLIQNAGNYIANEESNNISYPGNFATIFGDPVNSNSWANSLIRSAGGNSNPDFSGFDAGHDRAIDSYYFDPPGTFNPVGSGNPGGTGCALPTPGTGQGAGSSQPVATSQPSKAAREGQKWVKDALSKQKPKMPSKPSKP